jgi:hypothetical protein
MKIQILNLATNQKVEFEDRFYEENYASEADSQAAFYYGEDGGGGCDCEREYLFISHSSTPEDDVYDAPEIVHANLKCGDGLRFKILVTNDEGRVLVDDRPV